MGWLDDRISSIGRGIGGAFEWLGKGVVDAGQFWVTKTVPAVVSAPAKYVAEPLLTSTGKAVGGLLQGIGPGGMAALGSLAGGALGVPNLGGLASGALGVPNLGGLVGGILPGGGTPKDAAQGPTPAPVIVPAPAPAPQAPASSPIPIILAGGAAVVGVIALTRKK